MPKKKKEVEKKEVEKKQELILTYSEYKTGGEAHDPSDRWTTHEPEYIDFSPLKVFLGRDKTEEWNIEVLYPEFDVKEGDIIHLLIVRYQSGGTFGRSHGNWKIEGVYKTSEEASAVEKLIWEDDKHYKESERGYSHKKKYKPIYNGECKCWHGYFEALEGVEVESFLVH